eukprot:jgi/Undpi1/2630/HiC_scaffold_13.g06009.m1
MSPYKVICINISMRQNEKNRSLNKAAGVEGKISIPGEKSFFDTGVPDASCDVIVSQEAFLHAGAERHKVIEEASRVLKPGGRMVFTDFMQTKEAENKEVEVVCKAFALDDMATLSSYKKWGKDYGLEFVEFHDHIDNFGVHYEELIKVLKADGKDLKGVRQEFVEETLVVHQAWVTAASRGLINWGIVVLQKKPV